MKVTTATALVALLAPLQISAASLPLFGQSPLNAFEGENFPVEGENPLEYCSDPSSNILEILSVDLSPNPPVPGETLTIKAQGIFHEQVEKGAKILLQVKYGLIRLINQEADLCEQLENSVEISCPIEKGPLTFTKEVDLPKEIPPGKYSVLADAFTADKRKITCLQAKDVVFH